MMNCISHRLPPYRGTVNFILAQLYIGVNNWNGSLLDSVDAVIKLASTMTWKGKHPVVALVTRIYQTGVKLTKEAMEAVETQLQRLPSLEKWFVDIAYRAPAIRDS
jgi:hypothetical protein